jgi:phosphoserine phosphatase RsbX
LTGLSFQFAVARAAYPGFSVEESGDCHVVEPFDGGILLAGIDGLGHGSKASQAATAAAAALRQYASQPPQWLLEHCNVAIRGTRGAAVSIASINIAAHEVEWAGVGNVTGIIVRNGSTGRKRETLLAQGGVVGFRMPRIRSVSLPIHPHDTIILTTDGIRSGFLEDSPLWQAPQQLADHILERHKRDTDDALVMVCNLFPG